MLYYEDENIRIRDMVETDAQIITDGEVAQGWDQTIDKYEMRLRHQAEGLCVALVAEYRGEVAGYNHVYWKPRGGSFLGTDIPEIMDFGVLEKFRRHGIGSRLMDVAEQLVYPVSDTVCIGVGLHSGYGSAQRMYVKRGYIPDGTGVWYQNAVCPAYGSCANDDDLVLYLSKKLR